MFSCCQHFFFLFTTFCYPSSISLSSAVLYLSASTRFLSTFFPLFPLCLFPSRYLSLALALPVPRSPLFLCSLFFIVLSVCLSIHQCSSHFLRSQHARTTKQDKFTNMILKSASERREQRRNASTEPLVVGSRLPPPSLAPSLPPLTHLRGGGGDHAISGNWFTGI